MFYLFYHMYLISFRIWSNESFNFQFSSTHIFCYNFVLQAINNQYNRQLATYSKLYLNMKIKGAYLFGLILLLAVNCVDYESVKITQFKTFPHDRKCYTQGLFFLNETHLFQTCGMYNISRFQVMQYQSDTDQFKLQETFKSGNPIDENIFLQGATWLPKTNIIYMITWRQKKVFKLNRNSFAIEDIQTWKKDGWGLTNNETHMFVTDGGPVIYIVDENFKIQQEKTILDKNGRKVYSINELEYVVENGKPYIYANVYMERRIVKIDFEAEKVVNEFDMLKIIQNQKNLKYDEVINGIAYHMKSGKFLLTGKNWGNYYLVDLK